MNKTRLIERYQQTRELTLQLCKPLPQEVFRTQSMPDVSPPWWNLGHTTWFFARNILSLYNAYTELDKRYDYVLNSYYETFGKRIAREDRGKLTSPTTNEMYDYRLSVDNRMLQLINELPENTFETLSYLVFIGIQHEQQHQELLMTEIKHILSFNPHNLRQSYCQRKQEKENHRPISFLDIDGGLFEFGNVEGGWCWDNELSIHKNYIESFSIANRLITNAEYLDFVEDGGYKNALLWLSDGWHTVKKMKWDYPLYWEKIENSFFEWTLAGLEKLDLHAPVCHISFYEAHAFAEWKSSKENKKFRLPTEREWEQAARCHKIQKKFHHFLNGKMFHPAKAKNDGSLEQMYGVLWEWTTNHYEPYPNFAIQQGALAEYNGKFMNNQRILRGGSCVTPANHIRISYRNFWEASTRFQFTGIRLVEDLQ